VAEQERGDVLGDIGPIGEAPHDPAAVVPVESVAGPGEKRPRLITVEGRASFLTPPTIAARVRQVPLPGTVVETLAAHLAEREPGEFGTVLSGEGCRISCVTAV
jgi:hypothetical protein